MIEPKIIIKELASYFNAILVHALYVDRSPALNPEISKEWYCERIHTLMSPIPVSDNCCDWNMGDYPEGMYPSDFYNSFIKQTQISEEACDYWDEILINAPRKPPVFYNEIMTQKKIYNMLHFGLDASVNSLKGLLPHQRLYFYELLFGNVTVKRHFSFKPQLILNEERDSKKVQEYNKILKSIHDIREINMAHMDNIPPYLSDDYEKILQYVSSFTNTETYKEYEIDSLYQLLYLEILSMIKNKTKIRKCENCGKYFIVSKENIRYCHRLDENGTPCSVVGPQKAFKEKSKIDLALDGYNRAYKTHYARFQRGTLTTEEREKWRITAKEKLELVRSGKLSTADYIQWLKA